MAIARMLHRKISISIQVNKLSLHARLLFTWMIAHADDEGRLQGNSQYIKAMVVPMTNWPRKNIEGYLREMDENGLIHYWEENKDWFVEFINWNDYQKIRKSRFIPSNLPSKVYEVVSQESDSSSTTRKIKTAKYNKVESSLIKENDNKVKHNYPGIAVKDFSYKKETSSFKPTSFDPSNPGEAAAVATWRALEPDNESSFVTTYLWAYKEGLPTSLFYQYASEIKDGKNIKIPGAVFRSKVVSYLKREFGNSSFNHIDSEAQEEKNK